MGKALYTTLPLSTQEYKWVPGRVECETVHRTACEAVNTLWPGGKMYSLQSAAGADVDLKPGTFMWQPMPYTAHGC